MGGEILAVGRSKEKWGEERRSTQRRNMNLTTIMGGEEMVGVQAHDGRSGEEGRGTALVLGVGGAPNQGLIQAGHSLLSMAEDGLVPLDPGKLFSPDLHNHPLYHHTHPLYSGIVQEVVQRESLGSQQGTGGWRGWRLSRTHPTRASRPTPRLPPQGSTQTLVQSRA